ncbi:HNH endonuclease [Enterobacter asburiae]|nr:HNH endonuclease [Enterobacter asburiae]
MGRPKSKPLTIEESFKYDETSPSAIRRISGDHIGGVGNLSPAGYYRFHYRNKNMFAHQIVWILHGRTPPDGSHYVIDHIDGDTKNNKISNLRVASKSGNAINSKKHVNVSFCKRDKQWRGYFKINGKQFTKGFKRKEDAYSYAIMKKNELGGDYVPKNQRTLF